MANYPAMKTITNLLAGLGVLALAVILCNCSSVPDAATNAVLGGAGAYIGHEITEGEPEGALLGAMAGVATGALFNHARERSQERAYGNGYDKGRSDEVKRLYWVQKNIHRGDEFGMGYGSGSTALTPSYYEMPVPEHVASDGTIIEPHTEIIEVLEP